MTALAGWQNFYVIVGSCAGALIGLQFVVLTLISGLPATRPDSETGSAFATPTVVHFASVLGLSAIVTVPSDWIDLMTVLWGIVGLSGAVYAILVSRRMRHTAYRPQFEDWVFHFLLPLLAYSSLAVSAVAARVHLREALLGVGAAALLLLLTGIHNAWDAVTYHVFVRRAENERQR